MNRLVFDIETDGLLDSLSKLHSLVIKDIDKNEVTSNSPKTGFKVGLRILSGPTNVLIGHNIIDFDIPAIEQIYPGLDFSPCTVVDTLVLSRLLKPDLYTEDLKVHPSKPNKLPPKLYGSHSLKAWGIRLGILKGDFGETTDWSEWSPEMQQYCEQDVTVTEALYQRLIREEIPQDAFENEILFQKLVTRQRLFGFPFNREKAYALYATLANERELIKDELQEVFPPLEHRTTFIPKVNSKKYGYVKGEPFEKIRYEEFNPASRAQAAKRLQDLGWEPKTFTDNGSPKVDETTLSEIKDIPQAASLARYYIISKRIGQLAEGDQAWLRMVSSDGHIRGYVNPMGAVTGRCTHSRPNLAQVPSVNAEFGPECRDLFQAPSGMVMVGADLSGIELRCLAHYLNDPEFTAALLEGDIHTYNQQKTGLATRAQAKTLIYAVLYGAGDEKLGKTIGGSKNAGRQARSALLSGIPALNALQTKVKQVAKKRGFFYGLDGRKVPIRSEHAALNTLLQSAGGLVGKKAALLAYSKAVNSGFTFGDEFAQLAHVHDEIQYAVLPDIADWFGTMTVEQMAETGRVFQMNCPITGEYKIGNTWKDTH